MTTCAHPNESVVIIYSAVNRYGVNENGKVFLKFPDNDHLSNAYCEACGGNDLQDQGFTVGSSDELVRPN